MSTLASNVPESIAMYRVIIGGEQPLADLYAKLALFKGRLAGGILFEIERVPRTVQAPTPTGRKAIQTYPVTIRCDFTVDEALHLAGSQRALPGPAGPPAALTEHVEDADFHGDGESEATGEAEGTVASPVVGSTEPTSPEPQVTTRLERELEASVEMVKEAKAGVAPLDPVAPAVPASDWVSAHEASTAGSGSDGSGVPLAPPMAGIILSWGWASSCGTGSLCR